MYIIEFVQTNRSKSALHVYIYRSLSTITQPGVLSVFNTNTQIQMYCAMTHHAHSRICFAILLVVCIHIYYIDFPFRCCAVCSCRKKSHIFYSKLLLFICYFVVMLRHCDTIPFFILLLRLLLLLLIYLLLFCQFCPSSATLSEQIYVFQWNLFFSIPFQAIHICVRL